MHKSTSAQALHIHAPVALFATNDARDSVVVVITPLNRTSHSCTPLRLVRLHLLALRLRLGALLAVELGIDTRLRSSPEWRRRCRIHAFQVMRSDFAL